MRWREHGYSLARYRSVNPEMYKLVAVSWTRKFRRFEMRAENFTVADVLLSNPLIRGVQSVSAKVDKKSGFQWSVQ